MVREGLSELLTLQRDLNTLGEASLWMSRESRCCKEKSGERDEMVGGAGGEVVVEWEASLRTRFYFRCWEPRWVCGPARLT